MFAEYTARPRRVKAIQYDGTHERFLAMQTFLRKNAPDSTVQQPPNPDATSVHLDTPHMSIALKKTDWLIVNDNGVAFVAHDDAFHESYVFAEQALD